MITIKEYFKADSVESAYHKLMSGKTNCILGGMMWLRMQNRSVQTVIDLSLLGLDKIEEKEDVIEIGAMTTLRQMEQNELLGQYFGDVFKKAFVSIVGTQFRNTATIGGSVFSRFGFSDPLTVLLALDTWVVLYGQGMMKLEDFINAPYQKDLLIKLIIKKEKVQIVYKCQRTAATDFPNLTVAVSKDIRADYKIVVGARPSVARLAKEGMKLLKQGSSLEEVVSQVGEELSFGGNIRASKQYRTYMAKLLVRRSLEEIESYHKES